MVIDQQDSHGDRRQQEPDLGAATLCVGHLQEPPICGDRLHGQQADAGSRSAAAGRPRDPDRCPALAPAGRRRGGHRDLAPVRARMACHVGEGLADHADGDHLHGGRQVAEVAGVISRVVAQPDGVERGHLVPQALGEAEGASGPSPSTRRRTSSTAAGSGGQPLGGPAARPGRGLDVGRQRLELQGDAGERRAERVVQIVPQSPPLLLARLGETGPGSRCSVQRGAPGRAPNSSAPGSSRAGPPPRASSDRCRPPGARPP